MMVEKPTPGHPIRTTFNSLSLLFTHGRTIVPSGAHFALTLPALIGKIPAAGNSHFRPAGEVVGSGSTGNLPPASEWGAIKSAQARLYAKGCFAFKFICQTKSNLSEKIPRPVLYSVVAMGPHIAPQTNRWLQKAVVRDRLSPKDGPRKRGEKSCLGSLC